MGRRGLVALLGLSSWCLVMVERLFLTVPRGCLRFVIFPDHTHLLFLKEMKCTKSIVVFVIDDMITQQKIQETIFWRGGGVNCQSPQTSR